MIYKLSLKLAPRDVSLFAKMTCECKKREILMRRHNRKQTTNSDSKQHQIQLTALTAALNFLLALYFFNSAKFVPKSCAASLSPSATIHL